MLDKQNLSIMIGELSDEHIIDMENHIDDHLSELKTLTPDIINAITYASKEAYYMALKTLEQALISCSDA